MDSFESFRVFDRNWKENGFSADLGRSIVRIKSIVHFRRMSIYSRLMAAVQRKPKYVVTVGNCPEEYSNNNPAKFVRVNMEIPFSAIPPAPDITIYVAMT